MLATVTAGLYISWNGLRLISAATRLQGIFFWDFLMYLTEGFVFLITGLQARTLIADIRGNSLREIALSAALVCGVVIVARFAWMFPATYLPRWLVPSVARKDPAPPWQWPFALAFTGVRGVVSLAAALAIPLTTVQRRAFPRSRSHPFLHVFGHSGNPGWAGPDVAFGDSRPWDSPMRAVLSAMPTNLRKLRRVAKASRRPSGDSIGWYLIVKLSPDLVQSLRLQLQERRKHVVQRDQAKRGVPAGPAGGTGALLLAAERQQANNMYVLGELKDEARRRLEREFDLRESQLTRSQAE